MRIPPAAAAEEVKIKQEHGIVSVYRSVPSLMLDRPRQCSIIRPGVDGLHR